MQQRKNRYKTTKTKNDFVKPAMLCYAKAAMAKAEKKQKY